MNIEETIENKIIDLINSGAQGRVIISKVDHADKDLKLEKRADYAVKPLHIKIYSKEEEVPKTKTEEYRCIASFDVIKQEISNAILVIDPELKKISLHKNDLGKYFMGELEK